MPNAILHLKRTLPTFERVPVREFPGANTVWAANRRAWAPPWWAPPDLLSGPAPGWGPSASPPRPLLRLLPFAPLSYPLALFCSAALPLTPFVFRFPVPYSGPFVFPSWVFFLLELNEYGSSPLSPGSSGTRTWRDREISETGLLVGND